jgi:hypothetical protein
MPGVHSPEAGKEKVQFLQVPLNGTHNGDAFTCRVNKSGSDSHPILAPVE